jgi:hypothetical protein
MDVGVLLGAWDGVEVTTVGNAEPLLSIVDGAESPAMSSSGSSHAVNRKAPAITMIAIACRTEMLTDISVLLLSGRIMPSYRYPVNVTERLKSLSLSLSLLLPHPRLCSP